MTGQSGIERDNGIKQDQAAPAPSAPPLQGTVHLAILAAYVVLAVNP
ncbi:hypothetical protein [Kitasatospora aureofaciens]|nr:hypothetical protein [Kitasatospora aureofaciens]MBV6702538.1 hypothetical protein [Kitasatospora aureofaciens]